MNSLGPLMNTLYTQLPNLAGLGSSTSSPGAHRRARSRRRGNQRAFSLDPTAADLPDDLGAGFSAFADLFGRSDHEDSNGGVDFSSLLRTLVTEGQRQGIDALSALRAAGTVQDELRRFQQDPSAWFEGVSERFRAPAAGLDEGYNTRSRTRSRQQAAPRGRARPHADPNAYQPDSWWSNMAAGVNDFLKREPDQHSDGSTRRNRRSASNV